jgi:hypothetical protein
MRAAAPAAALPEGKGTAALVAGVALPAGGVGAVEGRGTAAAEEVATEDCASTDEGGAAPVSWVGGRSRQEASTATRVRARKRTS